MVNLLFWEGLFLRPCRLPYGQIWKALCKNLEKDHSDVDVEGFPWDLCQARTDQRPRNGKSLETLRQVEAQLDLATT